MTRPRALALLAAFVVLATGAWSPETATAGDGWWGALDEGEAVSLANVIRQPKDFRGRTLTFYCVFYTADGEYKYYPPNTAFTEANFINFSVWADGTPVWKESAFRNNFPFLYLRRTNAQRAELLRTKQFTRLECTGRIRDIVRGRPAIEVFSFRETGHRLGEPVVKSIMWGHSYASAGTREGYQSAARRFKEALQPDLPPVYGIVVRKHLADTLRRLGHHDEANRYENGETVGVPDLPNPDLGAPAGSHLDVPAELDAPPTGEFPEPPPVNAGELGAGSGLPDGPTPPPVDGPGSTDFPPAADGGMPAPPPVDPMAAGDTPATEPVKAGPRRGRRPGSGIPPTRRPRLTGVK